MWMLRKWNFKAKNKENEKDKITTIRYFNGYQK